MEYEVFTLPNGIRLIHKFDDSKPAHCGFIINTGSRDEDDIEHGMAHFIEHAIFKGTSKRKAYHILSRLEDVGGDLNAYTTKEETCIHATFLNNYYERAIDLIYDIVFNSIFPEKELEKEKDVVIDEINSYKDSPAELIFDEFEELIYEGQSLGRNILGNPKTLKNFKQQDITNFIEKKYHTNQMVFCSVGKIKFSKLVKLVLKYFGSVPKDYGKNNRVKFNGCNAVSKTLEKNTHQAHCIIGNIAYPANDKRRLGLILLNNILGGLGMNSRLNMVLREKHGLVYNVESSYASYSDTGALYVYFGTDKENLEKSIKLVYKEFGKLRDVTLGSIQLAKAKRQLIGQLTIGYENKESVMLAMGKSLLRFNKFDTLEIINKKIENITATQLQEIANEILNQDKLSCLIYK